MLVKEIRFRGYKTLRHFNLHLDTLSVLSGANNAGKSTALSALRLLDAALSYASRRSPVRLLTPIGRRPAYPVPTDGLAISLTNVHTDLKDIDTTVEFLLASGESLVLWFPEHGGCIFYVGEEHPPPKSPSAFRCRFPLRVVQVPVLGPLENDEPAVREQTVRRGLGTHRASRHFRNYWRYYPEGFQDFAVLVSRTWPGMVMEPPEQIVGPDGAILHMFCQEDRATRELYWCGFGFQIWCQLLTHISRAGQGDVLVIDEPETYLHPHVQRQLLQILRDTGAQVVLASHSTTLIASARPGEVLGIDREEWSEHRYDHSGVALCQVLGLLPELDAPAEDALTSR